MASGVVIRAATLADTDAVERVLAAAYPALLAGHYDPALLAVAMPWLTAPQPRLLGSGTYYVAADADGVVRGSGGWTAEGPGGRPATPGLAHLRHFATDPTFARRGVGRALVERCFVDAREHGRVRFEADSTLAAVAFWEALGFRVVERISVALPGVALPGVAPPGGALPGGLQFPAVRMVRG